MSLSSSHHTATKDWQQTTKNTEWCTPSQDVYQYAAFCFTLNHNRKTRQTCSFRCVRMGWTKAKHVRQAGCITYLHIIRWLVAKIYHDPPQPANIFFFFFQSVLHRSIAVSTICRHLSRVVAFLHAVARTKFMQSSVASLPIGRFQYLSNSRCKVILA